MPEGVSHHRECSNNRRSPEVERLGRHSRSYLLRLVPAGCDAPLSGEEEPKQCTSARCMTGSLKRRAALHSRKAPHWRVGFGSSRRSRNIAAHAVEVGAVFGLNHLKAIRYEQDRWHLVAML